MYVYMYVYIYIYIYIHTSQAAARRARGAPAQPLAALPEGLGQAQKRPLAEGTSVFCPLGGFMGAQEYLSSSWRGVPQGSPQGQTLRALLLRGTSVPH